MPILPGLQTITSVSMGLQYDVRVPQYGCALQAALLLYNSYTSYVWSRATGHIHCFLALYVCWCDITGHGDR